MTKKNLLQDFANHSISQKESDAVKGGRNSNPINTGSFGFIDWGDVGVRDSNFMGEATISGVQINQKFKKH